MKKFLVLFLAFIFLFLLLYFILTSQDNVAKVDTSEPVPVSFSGRVNTISTSSKEFLLTIKTTPNNFTKYLYIPLPVTENCPDTVKEEDLVAVVENAYVTVEGIEYGNGKVSLCENQSSVFTLDSLPAVDISSNLDNEKEVRQAVLHYLNREVPDAQSIAINSVREKFWQDSCLGLGAVGDVCDVYEVPGFLIEAEVDGWGYTLRTDKKGELIILDTITIQ